MLLLRCRVRRVEEGYARIVSSTFHAPIVTRFYFGRTGLLRGGER